MNSPSRSDAERLNTLLARSLTTCTAASAVVCILALTLLHLSPNTTLPACSRFSPESAGRWRAQAVLRDAASLEPLALAQLGVLLLILTPVARVASSMLLFLLQRDRLYALLSAFVLGALALGLLGLVR